MQPNSGAYQNCPGDLEFQRRQKTEKNEIKIGGKKSKKREIFKSKDCFEFPESRSEFSEVVANPNQIKIEDPKEKEDKKEEVKN